MIRIAAIVLLLCIPALSATEKKEFKVSLKRVEKGKFTEYREFLKELKEYNNFSEDRCLKMDLTSSEARCFKNDNETLDIVVGDDELKFEGKLIKSRNGGVIVLNDPDHKIDSGSAGSFSTKVKVHKDVLRLNRKYILNDEDGSFVYLKKGSKAVKKYIKTSPASRGIVMIRSGLKDGALIVKSVTSDGSDIPVAGAAELLGKKARITSDDIPPAPVKKKITKKRRSSSKKRTIEIRNGKKSFLDKLEFDVSVGFGAFTTSDLNSKYDGNADTIKKYADSLGLSHSATTSIEKIKSSIPFNLSVNYKLKSNLLIKIGLEFSSGKVTPSGTYTNTWPEINLEEKHTYDTENKVSYVMPYIGAEYRVTKSIGLYGALGLNSAKFTHKETYTFTEPGRTVTMKTDLEATGSSMGIIIGGKYIHKLSKKIALHGKIEFSHSKISSLSGDRTIAASDSLGNSKTSKASGTLYDMEIDPYGNNWWVNYWDMEGDGTPSPRRNLKKKSLNLTSIKVMVGITF